MNIPEQAYQATKAEGDPDWPGLQGDFRAELQGRADATIKTGVHQTPFETEVLKLHKASQEASKDDAPLAVGEVRTGLSEEEEAEALAKQVTGAEVLVGGFKEAMEDENTIVGNKVSDPSGEDEDEDEDDEVANLHNLKRAELDAVAEKEGLDPSEYSNIPDLIEAIESKRGEK